MSVTIDISISIVTSLTFDIITNKQLFINHSLNSFNKAFIIILIRSKWWLYLNDTRCFLRMH